MSSTYTSLATPPLPERMKRRANLETNRGIMVAAAKSEGGKSLSPQESSALRHFVQSINE